MLRIKEEYFHDNPPIRKVAQFAGLQPETVSRIINGKQKPSFAVGGSAERIAQALGWNDDPKVLFEDVEDE